MSKADQLRDYLVTAFPELARNPENLLIYMTGGKLVSRYPSNAAENLGFEYRAQLQLDVLGFSAEPAAFFLPLLLWLREHEPAALQNFETAENQLRFELDIVDGGTVDISMTLPMSEAVDVLKQPDGSYRMSLREEPPVLDDERPADPIVLLKRILHGDELLVGT